MAVSKNVFTPSLFYKHTKCPHWIWHDIYSDPKDKGEVPALAQKLLEQGVLHEEEYIKGLEFSEVKEKDQDKAFMETMKLMEAGTDLIYQGVIQCEIDGIFYRGKPDLLEKQIGKSKLGNYYYRPIDIKSTKEIKPVQIYQLTLYGLILEKLQDLFPFKTGIINKEHNKLEYDIEEKDKKKTIEQIDTISRIIKGSKPGLKLVSSCKESPWFNKCVQEAEAASDIALIYKLDYRGFPVLRDNGINTLKDMVEADINELPKIPYASPDKLKLAKIQAESLISNEIKWLSKPEISEAKLKIYFDIEGDPLLEVQYLFGFWIVGDSEGRYAKIGNVRRNEGSDKYFVYFIAEKPEDEQTMWNQFLEWLKLLPENDYYVYHYAIYERTWTRKLAEEYGGSTAFDHFFSRYIDFFDIVSDNVVFPIYFYSIKDIAKSKFVNYQWRHKKAGGGQSIFWYEEWLETGDRKILNDIIDYNEDDVVATEYLHNWLISNS